MPFVRVLHAAACIAGALMLGGCSFYAQSGWPAIHRDARNSDATTQVGLRDLSFDWSRSVGGPVAAAATVDPAGRVFVTSSGSGACHLHALDGATGAPLWCSSELNANAITSSALIDVEGNLFVGDDTAMYSFTPAGVRRWRTPIVGAPLSAQLTTEGHLIFITHIGRIYVLDRTSGALVMAPYELIPGATNGPVTDCLLGGPACPSANTLAIDTATGRFFFTFWAPGTTQAELRAMRFVGGSTPRVEPLWAVSTLPGGSASSPDLSVDGTRVYVTDNEARLWALAAATGAPIWDFAIGGDPASSPSVADDGLIIPGGSTTAALGAVQDLGSSATWAWQRPELVNLGVPVQAGGDVAYIVTRRPGTTLNADLLVLDTTSGAELDRVPLPGSVYTTVGTSIGPDGTVYAPSLGGTVFALAGA